MNTINANDKSVLYIGMQGETQRTQVVFDFSDVAAEFPGGTVVLLHQPAGQSESYPVSELVIDRENSTATWTIMTYDTPAKGFGECQLIYSTEAVCKSKIWKTLTDRSMTVTLEQVPNWQDLVETLVTAAHELDAAIIDAQETISEDLEISVNAKNVAVDAKDDAVDAKIAAESARDDAVDAKNQAAESESNAEAWAVGTRDGVDVSVSDETYKNNARYYAGVTQQFAEAAAVSEANAADSATGAAYSENSASYSASNARSSAYSAATSEHNAASSARSASNSEQNAAASSTNALRSERNAATSETNAVASETNAAASETIARYYGELAQQCAQTAGYVFFDIHDDDGLMYVTTTQNIGEDASFHINEATGELEVTVNG